MQTMGDDSQYIHRLVLHFVGLVKTADKFK